MINEKWIYMAVIVLLSVGCATINKEWSNAKNIGTYDVYVNFQKKWPQSEYILEINENEIKDYLIKIAIEKSNGNKDMIIEIDQDKIKYYRDKLDQAIEKRDKNEITKFDKQLNDLTNFTIEGFEIKGACSILIKVNRKMTYDKIDKILFTTGDVGVFLNGEMFIYSMNRLDILGGVIIQGERIGFGKNELEHLQNKVTPLFWQGMTHNLIGHLIIEPWEFYSDPLNPLKFDTPRMMLWHGTSDYTSISYKYRGGRGVIIGKEKVYLMGFSIDSNK
ncbi:MAG: hypothetical protein H8D45_02270 [Bacteroidetes bacterium]|nr:hypothetical protein [Bacteroidota bacterium]